MSQRLMPSGMRYLLPPLATLLIVVVLRLLVFDVYWVEVSPAPHRIAHRSWMIASKLSSLAVGDLVLYQPEQAGSSPAILSEIVATEGDSIESHGGRLYVNGKDLAQSPEGQGYKLQLNEGELWLLSPQPSGGMDSRHVGPVLPSSVIGRIVLHLSF